MLAIAALALPSCYTANAIRGFGGAESVRITVVRERADPQTLAWEVERKGPGDPTFTSEDTGSVRLPDAPPGCPTWELVRMDAESESHSLYSDAPQALRVKLPRAMTAGARRPPDDRDALTLAACQLEIGWFPDGGTDAAMRIREPGAQERALFVVPYAPAAEPATWGNLAVAPLLDLVIQPLR
ncbi:MAG: hypothetical protein ACRETX_17485, partial [Steroidobacteraceae bacterium]